MQETEIKNFIVDQLIDNKAQDIITIDVRVKSSITDYMIVCTGTSNRHLISVADKLIKACHNKGIIIMGIEGRRGISDWIIVDLGDFIVHIMNKDCRHLYELEKLWN